MRYPFGYPSKKEKIRSELFEMYNDRNRQMPQSARQFPMTTRCGGDLPVRDAEQGGRRCDGSLGRDQSSLDHTSRDQAARNRTAHDQSARGHMGNGNAVGRGKGWGLYEHPLAMVYSPYQLFRDLYTPDAALGRGTLFAELDLPFEASSNRRNGGCAR